MKKLIIINGPNLNLLGKREVSIYGNQDFSSYFEVLRKKYASHIEMEYFQSNHEGFLIDKLHEVGFSYDGVILNAGAYTHTSIALHDAIKAIEAHVVEVHISDLKSREDFRQKSYISLVAKKIIVGKGLAGYEEAVEYFL